MEHDELLFGASTEEGIVAIEFEEGRGGRTDAVVVFRREGDGVSVEHRDFEPFIVAEDLALRGCPVDFGQRHLAGDGPLDRMALFKNWRDCRQAAQWLAKKTRSSSASASAPYLFVSDPVQQHLLLTGRTLFLGMSFAQARRLQVDIECATTPGYDFCRAEREGDRILAIALGDSDGWTETLCADSEADMLRRFAELMRERDPDIVEGHNIFNFDLPYLMTRARRHGLTLELGRNGAAARQRNSRFTVGDRTIAYTRCELYGRHVADTFFMLTAYDVVHRSLNGRGLKEAARHFGIAADSREYIEGDEISRVYAEDRSRFLRYARDDIKETCALSAMLSPTFFAQTQMLPFTYQNVCVRGGGSKIDALMIREYLRVGHSLPKPDTPRAFAGGYAAVFRQGVVKNVRHCDVRSLYPSLMLARSLAPASDRLGVFVRLLASLKAVRMDAVRRRTAAATAKARGHWEAVQSAFKVLINSFYGYLGFAQARFSDFAVAEQVAAQGRELLREMVAWLERRGAIPVEIDTDGIYFVPPPTESADKSAFEADFRRSLPSGIEVEFDGEYRAMFSYKVKNYALLAEDGAMTIKGAALKSRGVEPFLRRYTEDLLRLRLDGREEDEPALFEEYAKAVRERIWPIRMLAKTETLAEDPESYRRKRDKGARGRSAAYELALKSGRAYRTGDMLSYYIVGEKKTVAAHEAARPVAAWDACRRDENTTYYLAKLHAQRNKFASELEKN